MTISIKRTCSELKNVVSEISQTPHRTPFDELRDRHAYVLLGAPGSGKTEVFKKETQISKSCHYETARNFLKYEIKSEWHNKDLFIDGLDEVRAGMSDGRTAIDAICTKLYQMNCSKFRISCRATEWFGANDREALSELISKGSVDVLYLDPLTDEQILEILHHNPSVPSVNDFLKSAREHGVDSLLYNPQSLNLLVQSVSGNAWPKSRFEVFERACKTLIAEYNAEHQRALPSKYNIIDLLDEAGRLCAHQLLTGYIGFKLGGRVKLADYIDVNQMQDLNLEISHRIFNSGLFEITIEEHVAPIHMNIAEFLAGRYLGRLIDENGLPMKRVLSLITGKDGGVISKFQNLTGWIASFSNSGRLEIISRDPLSCILYGDCSHFSVDHKKQLIEGLREQAKKNPWFFLVSRFDFRLGDFATPNMTDYFQLILRRFNKSTINMENVSFIKTVLVILMESHKIANIADDLVRILWKDNCPVGLKELALKAYIRHSDPKVRIDELKLLLNEVNSREIDDPDDSLLGWLLKELYPSHINPSDLLDYYHPRKQPNFYGSYHYFWWLHISKFSDSQQLLEVIDNFRYLINEHFIELNENQSLFWKYTIRLYYELVYQFFKHHSSAVDTNCLLHSIFGINKDDSYSIGGKEREFWIFLGENPEIQKKLLDLRVKFCEQTHKHESYDDFKDCMSSSINRLASRYSQLHLVNWYLKKAISADSNYAVKFFIQKVVVYSQPYNGKTDISEVLNRLKNYADIRKDFISELVRHKLKSQQEDIYNFESKIKLKQKKQDWHNFFKRHETALQNNVCPVSILNKLSLAYFGQIIDIEGNTPDERLNYLLGDESLIEATLLGFENSICRTDVPEVEEFLKISVNNHLHLLTYPILAGLDRLVQNTDAMKSRFIDENNLRKVLTLVFTTQFLPQKLSNSNWVPALLNFSSKIFSQMLTQSISFQLRQRKVPTFDLEELGRNVNLITFSKIGRVPENGSFDHVAIDPSICKNIAGQVSLSLLKSFPVRAKASQLPYLVSLLKLASVHGEHEPLEQVIESKLSKKSMHPGQRVYWLAGSLWVSGNKYLDELQKYIAVSKRRSAHLKRFLDLGSWHPSLIKNMKICSLRFYIILFGPDYRPINIETNFSIMNIPDRIQLFIDQLTQTNSSVACQTLEELSVNDDLIHWHPYLLDAIDKQNLNQRESEFMYSDIVKVSTTLRNKAPSNNADLAALIVDKLFEVGEKIRFGNTSDWKAYWILDSHKNPKKPQHEEICRDRLLSTLREKIHMFGVDAQPEGYYANDRRTDIKISYENLNIPIEIKKSSSKDLWTAIHDQLIPKYTRDPDTDGYGIYLVLWFGNNPCSQHTAKKDINTADELQQRLVESLSKSERLKISVCVIDVANDK